MTKPTTGGGSGPNKKVEGKKLGGEKGGVGDRRRDFTLIDKFGRGGTEHSAKKQIGKGFPVLEFARKQNWSL